MQFRTLVLPAPFGPISANSSAFSTAKETPSSTVSPPKRSESFSISSSAIPSPASAILLHIAIGTPFTRAAEIEFLNVGMVFKPLRVAIEDHAAVFQHIAAVGDGKC